MPNTKKYGPHNGMYRKLLGQRIHAKTPPGPGKKWSELSALESSRLRGTRVLWFRRHEMRKFKSIARWVKAIRSRMSMNQREFSKVVGVSTITIRRWECALGHTPLPKQMFRLKELECAVD